MEDSRIVALYFERNEDAITETDRKYGGYCRAIAMNILSDHGDAEECVNDTWLQTWNAIPPHRPTVLSAFLETITRRLSLDRWRKNTRKKRGGGQVPLALEELSQCVPASAGPEEAVQLAELTHTLEDFLKRLSSRDRDLFLCRYWYLASIREIAQAFRLPESRVKVILFRTRNKLKIYLEQEGFL